MASLRARLLAALLGLATVAMLLLAGITYAEQRSFLLERVDAQVREAPVALLRELRDAGEVVRPFDGPGGPRPGPGRGAGAGAPSVPAGTYGELRDARGEVVARATLSFADGRASVPELPADVPTDEPETIGDHRVLAQPLGPQGALMVVAVPLAEVDDTLERLLLVEGLVIAGVLLLLGAAAFAVVRVGLLPLDRMGDTAGAIAAGDLSRRVEPADPRTEVGRLGLALNAMLDRLEQAFADKQVSEDRLRRFLADASHELRTPLASIRGYGELHRMGALADEDEVRRAMARIEDESARMGVLVEDLLTLARLDEVADAPHVALDVAPLVRDAAEDARAMDPDREVTVRAPDGLRVVGDEGQLRQVLGNLVRNAVVHTPPGTGVELSTARAGGHVRLEVRDHGHGLPTQDAASLFERFWRAEGGRERGRGGAGLGLAIVAAIADAHGGRVHAEDAEGGGARFVVELPAAGDVGAA